MYGIPIQDSFDFSFAKKNQKQKNFIVFSTSTKKNQKNPQHFVNNKYRQCTLIFYPFNYPFFSPTKLLSLFFKMRTLLDFEILMKNLFVIYLLNYLKHKSNNSININNMNNHL